MTNNAFHKLCNEIGCNNINNTYITLCKAKGVSTELSGTDIETYVEIRKECKAKDVWLEDMCESDLYAYAMPNKAKFIIKEYRRLKREIGSNGAYRTLLAQMS